jgi:hypothetical protein
MRDKSSFIHAWVVPAQLEPAVWSTVHRDIVAVLRGASSELEMHRPGEELALLRGPNGLGPLVIRPDALAFNGNVFLGQAGDAFVVECAAQSGIIARRTSDGSQRTVRRCDTRGHPYDLAVCAVLIVLARELGDAARVGTSGTLRTGWGRAATLVRTVLGDGGQLVQKENGLLHWVRDVTRDARVSRSSA